VPTVQLSACWESTIAEVSMGQCVKACITAFKKQVLPRFFKPGKCPRGSGSGGGRGSGSGSGGGCDLAALPAVAATLLELMLRAATLTSLVLAFAMACAGACAGLEAAASATALALALVFAGDFPTEAAAGPTAGPAPACAALGPAFAFACVCVCAFAFEAGAILDAPFGASLKAPVSFALAVASPLAGGLGLGLGLALAITFPACDGGWAMFVGGRCVREKEEVNGQGRAGQGRSVGGGRGGVSTGNQRAVCTCPASAAVALGQCQ